MRAHNGRLLEVHPVWFAEAERYDGEVAVASASGSSPDAAWSALRAAIDSDDIRLSTRVQLLPLSGR